jgi:hypothetical protein
MIRTHNRILNALLAAAFAIPVFAQGFSFGLIGGVELNSDFHYRAGRTFPVVLFDNVPTTVRSAYERSRFAPKLGLKVEYEFTPHWSVEAGLLIHRPTFTSTFTYDPPIRQFASPNSPLISRDVSRYDEAIWEVPLLAKRTFEVGRRAVILEGGPSFRPFGGIDGPGRFGITGGVGTTWHVNRVRLQPSIRYTRWSDVRQPYTPAPFRRDEITLLLAVDAKGANLRGARERQPLSAGFIGGATLTKAFPEKNGWEGMTSRLAGVTVEYRFSDRWSAEANVLYHPLVLSERARATVVTWEVPLMAKYRFGSHSSRPLVTAGPAFRPSGNRNSTNPSSFGLTAGLGWEIPVKRLTFEPTLRYVRWGADPPAERAPASTRRDQLQAMLSIRFRL